MNERINGLFAKPIHVERFNKIKDSYERKIKRLNDVLDFTQSFNIANLIKENNYYRSVYRAQCKKNNQLVDVIKKQQVVENELRTRIFGIEDEVLKLKEIERIMTEENHRLSERITILNYKLSNK